MIAIQIFLSSLYAAMDPAVVVEDKAAEAVTAVEAMAVLEDKRFALSNVLTARPESHVSALITHTTAPMSGIAQLPRLSLELQRNPCAAVAENQDIRRMHASASMTLTDKPSTGKTPMFMRSVSVTRNEFVKHQ